MEKLAALIIRLRYFVIVSILLITAFFGYFIKDLTVNPDVLGYLPEDDRAATLFKEIGKQYGGNDLIIVGVEGKDVFTFEMLDLVRQVTDSMRTVSGISYVTSLTNVIDIKGTEYGIETGRLVDEYDIPTEAGELERLRNYALSKSMYRNNLVSADGTSTLVIGKVMSGANRTDAVVDIQEKLSGLSFDGRFYYGGMPVTLLELSNVIIRDLKFIAPLAFILICLILFIGFRNLRGVFMPMLAVVIAIIWTMGLISLLGYELTMITNVIPVILLAVGSAYAIHVINRFNREVASDPRQALLQSLVYVITPVFLASLTTVVGFLSFIAGSYLTMIMEFGLFTAIGIIFSLIMAVVFIPALLAVSGKKMQQNPKAEGKNRLLDGITSKINQLVTTSPKRIMWAWYLLILISLWGISRIERRVDLVDYFRKDNIVQQSEKLLKEKFNGSMPLYVKISGDIQSPEGLRLMKKTQAFMQQFDYIPYSQSVADLIEQMNDVMGEGAVIPNEKAKIEQLWFLLDGQEIMEQMVNFDLTEALIQGSVATTGLHVLREIEINFEAFAHEHSGPDFQMEVTGIPIMFKKLDDSIIKSQVYSLIIAMLLVVGIISLLQKSLIKGLMTIIPVFATLITLFGLMGLTGIPLDIATVLTGSVTIGIGIDYAIHFMTHFGSAYQQGKSIAESISSTLNISGRAILINMFSVTIGFAVLLFSNLVPLQRFGFLIAATMLISAMAALTLLPAVLLLTGDRLKQIFQIAENFKNNLNNHKHKQKIPKNG